MRILQHSNNVDEGDFQIPHFEHRTVTYSCYQLSVIQEGLNGIMISYILANLNTSKLERVPSPFTNLRRDGRSE